MTYKGPGAIEEYLIQLGVQSHAVMGWIDIETIRLRLPQDKCLAATANLGVGRIHAVRNEVTFRCGHSNARPGEKSSRQRVKMLDKLRGQYRRTYR